MSDQLADDDARGRIRKDIDRTLFVEAGAGSGKTKSLVDRVATLVLEEGEPIERIATVTFTERAGAELRDRLRATFERAATHGDRSQRERAEAALDGLDAAAIGTLHSFAQRILSMYPIQAGLPPLLEVLDEVASSVTFDRQWSDMQRRLLDDPTMSDRLLLALSAGIKLDHLRALARAFSADWDLIQDRIPDTEPPALSLPEIAHVAREARELAAQASDCSKTDDKFVEKLQLLSSWAERLETATSDGDRYAALSHARNLKWSYGSKKNWPDLDGLKFKCGDLQERIAAIEAEFSEATLRPLAHWIARRVLEGARVRAAHGTLQFHDLLVLARELLRKDENIREELHREFPRLLLDEFQDTDPIQIELAVRIAAGAAGGEERWQDVVVPPGALFVVGDPKQSIYRFRRASIETYLTTQDKLVGGPSGEHVALTTNFRTVAPILDWVNAVFAEVIRPVENAQPEYRPLTPHRLTGGAGAAVAVLGAAAHPEKLNAAELREAEACDVAAAIMQAIADGWEIQDLRSGFWRPTTLGDITILLPSRTSLPFLETALDDAGIRYRTESSSLVYQASEIRDVMAAARALADPSDVLACVTALRSPLFGCGDDDLFRYKQAGGSFNIQAPIDDSLADTPVGLAVGYLRRLHYRSRWMTPSEVLTSLVVDRRVLETTSVWSGPRARDQWRRVRFVIDQARAWSEVEHGGLREYLAWAGRQADESSRVAESVLPETDMDVVRIMTVHASKGLEFGMVVLSGMTSLPNRARGVQLLWTKDSYAVKLSARLQTNDFEAAQPIDEQMDEYERSRLLYVATTRARDHLVVSLHRNARDLEKAKSWTSAEVLADGGGATAAGTEELELSAPPLLGDERQQGESSLKDYTDWQEWITAAREESRKVWVRSPSGLEGTEPEVVLPVLDAPHERDAEPETVEPGGDAKGPRDLELPPWSKGRYGNLVGRAVHGVLQTIDLVSGEGLQQAVAAQCLAEGVTEHADAVEAFVRSALESDLVQRAAAREHWRESFIGTKDGDGILEGFTDLIYREDDGSLVIVDYKIDTVPQAALPSRIRHYSPQLRAYAEALTTSTDASVSSDLLFLRFDGAPARRVPVVTAGGKEN